MTETPERYDAGDAVDEVKHTPAPWRIEEIDGAIYIRGANGHIIAEVGDMGYNCAEDRANARLLIAAPELLAACEEAKIFLDTILEDHYGDLEAYSGRLLDSLETFMPGLRAAIAKAKGQRP